MDKIDFLLLTERRYTGPTDGSDYLANILLEDSLLTEALISRGMTVHRAAWDDISMVYSDYAFSVFRTTWDYFDRFDEFSAWLKATDQHTCFINPRSLISWNLDKKYLLELSEQAINIPPTMYFTAGENITLDQALERVSWKEFVLKPAVSGAGRHTYRFKVSDSNAYSEIFGSLLKKESLILQEFQENILTHGEIALMFFDGVFSHSIIKKAKQGEFRVQDDFGGTVDSYDCDASTIAFATDVIGACPTLPVYARVDLIWDNDENLAVSELELIEPELWLRYRLESAEAFAEALIRHRNAF